MQRSMTHTTNQFIDQDLHIKKSIANIVRRAQSAGKKSRNSYRSSRQVKLFKKECDNQDNNKMFWRQYTRSSRVQTSSKDVRQRTHIRSNSSQNIRKNKTDFFSQMLAEEQRRNSVNLKLVKQKLESKQVLEQFPLLKEKGRKQLVQKYIFKHKPSLRRQMSDDSQMYLESKKNIPRRSIISNQIMQLIKM